jgi:flagellar protein FliO/FliZ
MALPALAQESAPAIAPSSLFTGDYLLQVLGSFVVVILLLVAVLVLLKRFNGVSTSMGGDMRVVSSVGVGQRERAVLLQVGEQQVLLGVGPGNVRALHVFDEPAVTATPSSTTPVFQMYGRWQPVKRGQIRENFESTAATISAYASKSCCGSDDSIGNVITHGKRQHRVCTGYSNTHGHDRIDLATRHAHYYDGVYPNFDCAGDTASGSRNGANSV